MVHRYAELKPTQLLELWGAGSPAIIPWGALEWHGDHLPLGLDGLVAEWFGAELAGRVGGVLLPTIWLPITTLPHPTSLQVSTETLQRIVDGTIQGLVNAECTTVVVLTGHYAQGHLVELYESAVRAMDDYPEIRVLVGTPLELLGDPAILDHAGRYETSQLLAIRPDLVSVEAPPENLKPKEHAVLGDHPALGTAEEGRELLSRGLESWQTWISDATRDSLSEHYGRCFDNLQPYINQYYKGSWEEAILAWWATK